MALPYPNNTFDAAVMALVVFFIPEPPRGIAILGAAIVVDQ
jgi:hypothetical protein